MVVVVPPGGGDPDARYNPLINLNYEATQLALLVGTALQSDGGKQAAVDAGGTGEFTVETTFSSSSAQEQLTTQLNSSADASDPESARRSAQALVEYARAILNKVQRNAGVPVENDAQLVWVVEPQAGKDVPTSRYRRAGAYGVGTIFAGFVLTVLFDAFVERRRGRSVGRRRTGSGDDNGPASSPADEGGAADRHPLTPQTVGPDGSKGSRHRYRPEAVTDRDAIRAANPLSMYSPPPPAPPDPS